MWEGIITTWNYPRSPLICHGCSGRRGFTNISTDPDIQWWVCGKCLKPTEGWFKSQGDDVLNMFRGGPLDGYVYTSTTLLSDNRLINLVLGYQFGNEVVTSVTTGKTARVWSFDKVPLAATTDPQEGNKKMTSAQETQESAEAPAPAPEPIDASDIRVKREELKLSRTPLAAEAGVTIAQLARIENGGKRTTQAEADQVRAALTRLAERQPAPAPTAEGDSNPT